MHRFRSVHSAAALLATALLGLSGCGTSEEERRTEAFCQTVPDLLDDVAADLQGVTVVPEQAPTLVADAVERLEAVDPPEDVAEDWRALVAAWTELRDLLERVDLTDPAANTGLEEEAEQLQTDLASASIAVEDWGRATC